MRYLLVAGIFLVALGLRFLLLPVNAGAAFLTFYPGAVVASLLCGVGPTLAYILVAAPVAVYVFNPPYWAFGANDVVPMVAFIGAATIILAVVNFYQRRVARQTQMLLKLAKAVEQSAESIVITNLDADIEYVNEAFVRISGFRRDEVLGKNARLLRSGKTPPATYAALWQALLEGKTWQGEFINRRKNDGEYVESAIITPIRQGDGRVSHYVAVKADVTARKRDAAELDRHRHHLEELVRERTTALEETNDRLLETQFALENVGIGIHWVDAASGRFIHVNRYAASMLGYSVAEMLELGVPDIDPNFDAGRFGENIERLSRQGGMQFESSNLTKDGRLVPVEVTLYYLSGEATKRAARVVAFLKNITQRKEAESMLLQAKQSAEAANAAKTAFLANMSHEIRTPLHVIIGLGHLLRRDLADPVQLERLDQLAASSDHLLALINDVLDLSKIEAERLIIDRSDFSLGTVVDQVMRMTEGLAREKGLTLTTVIAPDLRVMTLNGDALRLAQVLINLCGNAIKFTDRGGVRLSLDVLAEDAATVTVGFAVADSGIGIAPEDQARLFQPFQQADSSTTRERGGTGLGLAICQRLVGLMGGTIRVDSCLGAGSNIRFTLVLPRAAGGDAAADVVPSSAADFRGRHVLCAEDHPLSQEILLEMLEDIGCVAEVAADGAEALACARERSYDLILMDMQMPVMDGLAAARAIRALPAHRSTPIIALTANAFAEDRQRCLDAGMNGHLGKPVTPATLAAVLGQWLPNLAVADGAAPCENAMSRALDAIPGLSMPALWRRSAQRLGEYCAQLLDFVQMHGEDMARLRQHVAAGDDDAAHVLAHNLKGIAGLIGARRVAALAGDILQALRAQADAAVVVALANACEAELAGLAEALRRLPEPAAESVAT
ncbi:MAG: PAS domain S-box protein [Rhodocyclaceae bacterium]|nr:PAS domain S-box protein [Rhodocyclaceae bacterium]